MPQRIKSDALDFVSKAVGIFGAGSPVTELADGEVLQTLDVAPLIRRGRTEESTHGIFLGIMRNTHLAANTQVSTIDPYNVGAALGIPPYPDNVNAGFDIWLIGCSLRQTSGAGTIVATLSMNQGPTAQGWGVDEAGGAIVSAPDQPIVLFDSFVTASVVFGITEAGQPWAPIGLRIPRSAGQGTTLTFTTVSSEALGVQLQLVTGLLPVALGQDIAV